MRLDITGRHVEITAAAPAADRPSVWPARARCSTTAAVSAIIILTKEKYRLRTEIAVHTRGDHVLRGNGEGNALAAVDAPGDREDRAAGADAQGQVGRAQAHEAGAASRPASAGARRPRCRAIVRATRYAVKPMSIEDAALRVDGGSESVRRVPQRRDRRGQHPVPAQGRQSRTDRAGLSAATTSPRSSTPCRLDVAWSR